MDVRRKADAIRYAKRRIVAAGVSTPLYAA